MEEEKLEHINLVLFAKAADSNTNVDVENRIIRNAIIAQVGEAQGYGYSIEQSFIDAMVADNAEAKCNFGHNYNNMGLQLGRAKNIRAEIGRAVCDLHIYKNADNSPVHPKMGTWLLEQAQEDPESVMLSIVIKFKSYYQYDENGLKRHFTYRHDYVETLGTIYIEYEKLISIDVVDNGALTSSMFSKPTGFFHSFWATAQQLFFKKGDSAQGATTVQIQALQAEKNTLQARIATLEAEKNTLQARIATLEAEPATTPAAAASGNTNTNLIDGTMSMEMKQELKGIGASLKARLNQ